MGKVADSKKARRRLIRTFGFFRFLLTPFVKLKFNYSFDKIDNGGKPFLLLINHNLNTDAILVGLASKEPLYFVASEHMLRGGLGAKWVMRYFQPIIHTKGKTGVKSLGEMMKALKAGYSVALFPEGNRSFNGLTLSIPENTGRIAKKSGASLITYRMEGGYFTHPRWSTSVRRGKMRGNLVNIYSPEKLETMTDEEINEAVNRDLYEDAFATQERENVRFKGKNLALGLESTVFMCPSCGKIGTLTSDSKHLWCKECDFKAEYTEYGFLEKEDGEKLTVRDLDMAQKKYLEKLVQTAEGPIFEDDISVYIINEKHVPVNETKGRLVAYKDHVTFNGRTITVEDIHGLSITARNILGIHMDGGKTQYEIRCGLSFNGLKYVYLYALNGGL